MTNEKIIVFVDGANVFYAQKDLGWVFDWRKFVDFLKSKNEKADFRYYVGTRGEKEKPFLSFLQKIGFKTVTKPLKKVNVALPNEKPRWKYKANFDVEITTDILLQLNKTAKVILLSGDCDFAYIVNLLINKFNKKVDVYSSHKFLSWELKRTEAVIYYFEDIKEKIFWKNWPLTKTKNGGIKDIK